MAPTLRDVAALAEVSYGTVARVVHNKGDVAEDTRKRVQKAITELDYRPNAIARSLRKRRTMTVGVVVSNIMNPRFAAALRGVQEVVEHEGYRTVLGNTNEDIDREYRYLDLMLEQRVDGLVLIPSGTVSRSHIRRMLATGTPLVLLNRYHEGVDRAVADSAGGARMATRHLLELGHRRIGVIVSPTRDSSSSAERVAAFLDTMRVAGVEPDPSLLVEAGHDEVSGYEAVLRLLSMPDAPTALLPMASFLTLGALQAIRDKGLRIPDEISIVGFNENRWAAFLTPPLTVVADEPTEMGRAAARLLFQRVKGRADSGPAEVRLPVRLHVRASTGPPRTPYPSHR